MTGKLYNFLDLFVDDTAKANKIKKSDYEDSGKYPIFDQGKEYIAGWTNRNDGLYTDVPVILFGDHTRVFKYIDRPFFLGADGTKILKPLKSENIKYWYFNLQAQAITNLGYSRHFKILKEMNFIVHPNQMQSMITEQLNLVDRIINNYSIQAGMLEELKKSLFIEMFGDPTTSTRFPHKALQELTDVLSGGTPSRNVKKYWENGTIDWVKTTELRNSFITEVDEKITQEGLDNSPAKIVPAGTILVAMYGQGKTRGMTGLLVNEAATNQACACILPSEEIDQFYLWQFFIQSYEQLRELAKGGNQPNLNVGMIKNYMILVPPIELQQAYSSKIKQIDKSKFVVQQSIEQLETLKKSLLQKYFSSVQE